MTLYRAFVAPYTLALAAVPLKEPRKFTVGSLIDFTLPPRTTKPVTEMLKEKVKDVRRVAVL